MKLRIVHASGKFYKFILQEMRSGKWVDVRFFELLEDARREADHLLSPSPSLEVVWESHARS